MSILVWNCRGLENLRTRKELEVVIRAKVPSGVFIAETWADEARLQQIKWNIEFNNLFFVERNNKGGGLALFWRNSVDLSVDSFSPNHIDSIINKGKEDVWRFTGFYGEPMTHKRLESQNKFRRLHNKFNLPWLCAGDFNEIIRSSEKMGGGSRSQTQMQQFWDAMDECGFIELGFLGPWYTWQKHFQAGHSIWERLDRALATNDWLLRFACTHVHHLKSDTSDHSPLWIDMEGLNFQPISKPFRFGEAWLSDHTCSEVVEAIWEAREVVDPAARIIRKIDKCGRELKKWERDHFGNIGNTLKEKRKELAEAEKEAVRTGLNFRIQELKKEITELVDKENRLWFQRSKVLWAKQGDRNSKYFHSQATQRWRKNTIQKLRSSSGQWKSNNTEVAEILIGYFQELYTSANQTPCDATTMSIEKIISPDLNNQLEQEFTAWEVQKEIKEMAPLKAPSPNGMPPLFYQHYWSTIGNDVT